MSQLGKQLSNPPTDGVSGLRFGGDAMSDTILASSWDGTVRLYGAASRQLLTTLAHGPPVLDADFDTSGAAVIAGGLDGAVKRLDVQSGQQALLGSHGGGVRCVQWLKALGLAATAAWDGSLQLWDPRAADGGAAASLPLPGKAYSMSQSTFRLVVATSGRYVDTYDLRALATAAPLEQRRESALKHQTRCVACFASGEGYAIGSIEGRVAMEHFDLGEMSQARNYAFKCHRRSEGGRDCVYPVNAIAFNAAHGTFATGGGDGVVNVWDGEHKKRLHQVAGYPTSVAALAFNASATLLAVAASYTYERGDVPHAADAIYVREMAAAEVTPRQRQQ